MAIENTLERIAVALEKIATNGGSLVAAQPLAGATKSTPAPVPVVAKPAAKVEEKPAAKVEETPAAKVEEKPAAKVEEKPAEGPDLERVRKALQNFRALEGTASMLELLREFKAENIGSLKPEDYAAVIQRAS